MITNFYFQLKKQEEKEYYLNNEADITRIREMILPSLYANPVFYIPQNHPVTNQPSGIGIVTNLYEYADQLAFTHVYSSYCAEQQRIAKGNNDGGTMIIDLYSN